MPHYKVPNDNTPHWLDSAEFEFLLPIGSVQITDAEADEMRKPAPLTGNALILSQISAIEAKITMRRLREAAADTDNGWLAKVNADITALRAKLTK